MFRFRSRPAPSAPGYDPAKKRPVIRSSICTGEQTGCLQDRQTGRLEEVMLLRTAEDRAQFCKLYGVREEEVEVVY